MKTYLKDQYFGIAGLPLWGACSRQSDSVPVHNHDFIEIVFVGQGCAVHDFIDKNGNKRTYGLIQGDVFTVMPDELHGYHDGRNLVLYNIGVTRGFIAPELPELELMNSGGMLFHRDTDKVHLTLNDRETVEKLLKRIILECALRKPGFQLYARSLLMEFLLTVGRVIPTGRHAAPVTAAGILKTIRLMESAPEKTITLPDLAKSAAMSVSHYAKKFREATGSPPLAYLINLRLENARNMLENTSLSVAEIAFQCGFCDSNYMIRLFRRRHGIPPAGYRNLLRRMIGER